VTRLHGQSADKKVKIKVKADIALHGNPVSELWDVTCHMGSHNVTCHPTAANTPCLKPSHAGWYSIYLPWRDGRLSWPSWLDSASAGSQTSDLSITSPMPNRCTTRTTELFLVVTHSECTALRRGTPWRQNCVLLLCVLTLSTNNWKLICSRRALTQSALDDILRLFILHYINACIDWLIEYVVTLTVLDFQPTSHGGTTITYDTTSLCCDLDLDCVLDLQATSPGGTTWMARGSSRRWCGCSVSTVQPWSWHTC